jgi:hypothetical protein
MEQEMARSLQGQLTCTLHLDDADDLGRALMPILERKAGRVLANGFPTGVEVVDAMVHGGPYPASTNFGATSVGTMSIRRFLRPVSLPEHARSPASAGLGLSRWPAIRSHRTDRRGRCPSGHSHRQRVEGGCPDLGCAAGRALGARPKGRPGRHRARTTYRIDGPALCIEMEATTDAPTIVNLVNHAYFNLAGQGAGDIMGQHLQIEAAHYLPVDAELIPTGEILTVAGTPFDFRQPRPIGAQLPGPGGFDHNLCLSAPTGADGLRPCLTATDPASGRRMRLSTTEPGVQLYTGAHFAGGPGKPVAATPASPVSPSRPSASLIGFSQIGSESGWRAAETSVTKQEAEARGIDLKFADAQQKQENQIKAIRGFIAQGVDAILVAPVVATGWDGSADRSQGSQHPGRPARPHHRRPGRPVSDLRRVGPGEGRPRRRRMAGRMSATRPATSSNCRAPSARRPRSTARRASRKPSQAMPT